MEIIIGLILAALIWLLTLYITYIIACMCIYFCQEVNHTMRNFKRDLRQTWWDLEWQWKLITKRR